MALFDLTLRVRIRIRIRVRHTLNYIVRKPLIVTLSVKCTLKGTLASSFSCWDGQYKGSKAMLLCIVYAMLFVKSVDIYHEHYKDDSLCCCMQDATWLDSANIPWILQNLFFLHASFFGWEVSLIFLIIDLTVNLELICILAYLT